MGKTTEGFFIFGNESQIHFRGYRLFDENECVCINLEGLDEYKTCEEMTSDSGCIRAEFSTLSDRKTQNLNKTGYVPIEGITTYVGIDHYPTSILEGQNFYFIIWENQQGDKQLVVSE